LYLSVLRLIAPVQKGLFGKGRPRAFRFIAAMSAVVFAVLAAAGTTLGVQLVAVRLPPPAAAQVPLGRVPSSNRLDLTFSLPLRHPQALTNLLRQIYQRGSTNYHHYLKPDEFTAVFGPTEKDYQSVLVYAIAHGLTVKGTNRNRTLVDVVGSVGDVENALHVHFNRYLHPTENRAFFAPDAPPSIDLGTPILTISGLHDYTRPRPCISRATPIHPEKSKPQSGSGSSGSYFGGDFRAAYVPGVSLNGAGQTVGLFELDGYYASDITNYENMAGMTNYVPLQNVLVDGYSGGTQGNGADPEVCLDIEMAISMAPGLTNVVVYEGDPGGNNIENDILNRMATDDLAQQMSCSWLFDIDAATDQIFQQFAAQGQSFFQASGDYDAYVGPIDEPSDDPNITIVGGTSLATSGPLGGYAGESVWNVGGGMGSSGGISVVIPIPYWQQSVNMTSNQGSTTMRNLPDVAMLGYYVYVQVTGQSGIYQGTSIAAPLWAGFTALVNQQAALNGQAPLGFFNPAIYAIGQSSNYNSCFHDITDGNNASPGSPSQFYAEPGYDLCTGWGTPNGSNLIAALVAPPDALFITPQAGFTATGPAGGPYSPASQTYLLTNAGNVPLNWSLANTTLWLSVSQTNGTLLPGGPGLAVTVSLNSVASNSLLNDFSASIRFTNMQDYVAQSWPFTLESGNGGFETGDFTDWTFVGDTNSNFAVNIDDSNPNYGSYPWPGASYAQFVHSGLCGTFLGQAGFLASLSQTLPTTTNQIYLLSCWLTSLAYQGMTSPNEFRIDWNGSALFDQTDLPAFGWTDLEFLVTGTNGATTLEFECRDDPAAMGLDDITLQAVPSPVFQTVTQNSGTMTFAWNALPGLSYQLQYTTDMSSANWTNLGAPIIAATTVVTASDIAPGDSRRFYRFAVSP
jgi:hypothetical protein